MFVPVALLGSGCAIGVPGAPTDVTATSVRLHGSVFSNFAGQTTYWFEYGETGGYGSETPRRDIAIADDDPHAVAEQVQGLSPDTTYHYRLCAYDEQEPPPRTVCSRDRTFATVGDYVRGAAAVSQEVEGGTVPLGYLLFDARSGSAGENPAGTVQVNTRYSQSTTLAVTCLRANGSRVTIGGTSANLRLFMFVDAPTSAQQGRYREEPIGSRAPTDCPAPGAAGGHLLGQLNFPGAPPFELHDAP